MKTTLIPLAATVILAVPFASPALALPKTGSMSHSFNHKAFPNYHLTHGTKFAQGYFYKGRDHSHWRYSRFDSRYGCQCYFDPYCSSWYYWCQPDLCFYPVTYCPYRTYCWTQPVVVQPVQPVCPPVCTSVTVPISKQVQTITRTVFATTTTCTTPPLPVTGAAVVSAGAPGGDGPPLPAPLTRP